MKIEKAIATLVLALFLVACGPSDFEKQKLAFEQQKYKDEQAAKAAAAEKEEEDKREQKERWMNCRISADNDFNNEFKNWGEPVPGRPGIRNGPAPSEAILIYMNILRSGKKYPRTRSALNLISGNLDVLIKRVDRRHLI